MKDVPRHRMVRLKKRVASVVKKEHLNITKAEPVSKKTKAVPVVKETEAPAKNVSLIKEKAKIRPLKKVLKREPRLVRLRKDVEAPKKKEKAPVKKDRVRRLIADLKRDRVRRLIADLRTDRLRRRLADLEREKLIERTKSKKEKEEKPLKDKVELVKKAPKEQHKVEKPLKDKVEPAKKAPKEQPKAPAAESITVEEDLPYFQCFFVDEDEAQFPFYSFSPLVF